MASFQLGKINQPIDIRGAIVQRLKAMLNTVKYDLPLSTFGIDLENPDRIAAITEEISNFFPELRVESVSIIEGAIEIFVVLNNEVISVRNN